MSGRHISAQQQELYMASRHKGAVQALAAAQAGISERSGRSIESDPDWRPAGQRGQRTYRTRQDPFAAVWATELEPRLRAAPHLQARTLLEHLQVTYPERYPDRLLRTLQRRVRQWRAEHGTGPTRFFPQDPQPGFQMQVDFTEIDADIVTIAGEPLAHRLAHARLRWSGWSHAEVVLGGESMQALRSVVVHALESCGGSPRTLRTDSLSAAYRNLNAAARDDVTADFQALCDHYGMEPTRNNRGESHENGAIESSHGHLKNDLIQQLALRGSHDFADLPAYVSFVDMVVSLRNRRCKQLFSQERPHLQALPRIRDGAYVVRSAKVSRLGNVVCDRVNYVVPQRLVGHTLTLHIFSTEVVCYLGQSEVHRMPRCHPGPGNQRVWAVDFRLVIADLIAKPGAFRGLRYREALHPDGTWRQAWESLDGSLPERDAVRTYLALLHLAAQHTDEVFPRITAWVAEHIHRPESLCADTCRQELDLPSSVPEQPATVVHIKHPTTDSYDVLLPDRQPIEEAA